MKKLITLLLTLVLILTTNISAFASNDNSNNYYDDDIFNALLFSYNDITKNSDESSTNYYNEMKSNGISEDERSFANDLILQEKKKIDISDPYSIVLFIQDNYDNLCQKLSSEEKVVLDKYLLDNALKYYSNLGELPPLQEATTPQTNSTTSDGTAQAAAASVCTLTIFADKSTSLIGISGGFTIDAGTHAWIHIKNTSTSTITVGTLSVAAGSSRTIGTWGNKPEHLGGFYNLEGYYIGQGAYNDRYSTSISLTASQLNTLNSTILFYDGWSVANNCSSFAARAWNAARSTTDVILNAGIIPTPKNLADDIINKTSESHNASCPYGGYIYYDLNSPTRYIP